MEAKKFLEDKQTEHFNKFGVYADTNSKIAEWIEEYTKQYKIKAEKWDKLNSEISRFYKEEYESTAEEESNLLNLGEITCIAFGYL
jgi:GTP-binding protein EngB required for normal cell division